MLKQAIEVFKKIYDEKGETLILDSYIPKDGTYIIVKLSEDGFNIAEAVDIKLEKSKEGISIDRTNEYFDFICKADYYSVLLDMNKPIASKKIHSNNYLSFFIKKDVLIDKKSKAEIDKNEFTILIDNYYAIIKDFKKKYTGKELEIYNEVEKEIGEVNQKLILKIQKWIVENIYDLLLKYKGNDYLKIFFYYEDYYQNEAKRYIIPKIYNSTEFNIQVDDMIYGLPNDNIGLNAKKPYLEHKTRKNATPYLISKDEVMTQKKFFDYLLNLVNMGKVNIYIDDKIQTLKYEELPEKNFSGMYFRIKKGKEVEIHDFDIIVDYTPTLIRAFNYIKYLDKDYEKMEIKYGETKELNQFQTIINEVLFSKILINNYFTEKKDIKIHDNTLVECVLLSRKVLFDYFYKGRDNNVWGMLNRVSLKLVKKSILNGYAVKAIHQFNLRMSLKSYFEGGNKMADTIMPIKEGLRKKIKSEETLTIENNEEYYFAIGQLVQYLISRSKSSKSTMSLVNPFINSRKDELVKIKLKALFRKYNYDINKSNMKFKNLFAMVMSYTPDNKVNEDMIIAGYLHSNLLYEKKEEEKEHE